MKKLLLALYVACAAASAAYVLSQFGAQDRAPLLLADKSHEPT